MISWIQNTFQHHFRTIFAVMLGLIIISFVFTIGASPGLGRADRTVLTREFFGYNLGSQADQQRLMSAATLSASLQVGSLAGLESEQVQSYAFQRAASLHLADELHLPAPTTAEIADFIKGLRMFAGADGQFDPKAYATFRDNLKTNPNITEADIARVLGEDIRAEKIQKLLAGPGYVLPGDIKLQLARADTSWTLATATADYTAFDAGLKPTDADLNKFFDDNAFRYEISPRVAATYVSFPAINYLAGVTVTPAEVRAYYDANPMRFPKAVDPKAPVPAAGATPPKPDPAADFAAVSAQVEAALKFERAQQLAVKAASDFVFMLYDRKVAAGPAFEAALAAQKLTPQPLVPFTREAGPAELGGSPEIADAAFKLGADKFYSDALPAAAGAVILIWKETLPSRKPAFAEVRAKVATDYTESEKRKRFVELGKTIRTQLETRLKAGDTFEKAAAAAAASSGAKLEAKALPAFTPRDRPQDLDYSVLGALEHLDQGQVSDMIVTADKGIFVYAVEKKAPDLTAANPKYVETRTQLGAYTARLGSGAVLSELVELELKKSEPKVR